MKFDPDLVRTIMLKCEEIPAGTYEKAFEIEGKKPEDVFRHIQILMQEGFIEGRYVAGLGGGSACGITDLTYKGHQFLESARNDNAWNTAKKTLKDKGIGLTISFINDVLVKLATNAITHGLMP